MNFKFTSLHPYHVTFPLCINRKEKGLKTCPTDQNKQGNTFTEERGAARKHLCKKKVASETIDQFKPFWSDIQLVPVRAFLKQKQFFLTKNER